MDTPRLLALAGRSPGVVRDAISPLTAPGTSSSQRYTTIHTNPMASLLGDRDVANVSGTREIEAKGTSAGVIQAFRELQDKAKELGIARAQALTTAHNLRNELSENRRSSTLDRSKVEIEATDLLLLEKGNREMVGAEHNEMRTRVAHAHEDSLRLQRLQAEKAAVVAGLEDEVTAAKARNIAQEEAIHSLGEQTRRAEKRVRALQDRLNTEGSKSEVKRSKATQETSSLQQRIVRAGKSSMRTAMRCTALEKYMTIILQINGDLCSTIATTEESRAKIARISAKYMPPRYAWPVRPYTAEFRELGATDEGYIDFVASPRGSPRKSPTKQAQAGSGSGSGSPGESHSHTPSPKKRVSSSTRSRSPRRETPDPPMSPSEFARQMMSANAELDEEALATAIRSMKSVPETSGASTSRKAVARYSSRKRPQRGRGETGYIPNAATFSQRMRMGQNATARLAKDTMGASIRDSPEKDHHYSSHSPEKPVWMPSSTTPGRSQNVVAAVSRASRAAGYLNATIASKVRSLTGSAGSDKRMYGNNLRYVTIRDLYGKLGVIKRTETRASSSR
jgi:hypothetical protein